MRKTLKDFQKEVAQKHRLGNALVIGHRPVYFDEATELYIKYLNEQSELILLSTPYSNPDPEVKKENRRLAAVYVAALLKQGLYVFSPITHGLAVIDESKENLPDDWNFWQGYCEAFVNACGKVFVANIPGWDKSSGVQGEIDEAKKQGKKVFLIELFGYCEGCSRAGMRHCAHADTCGSAQTFHKIVREL